MYTYDCLPLIAVVAVVLESQGLLTGCLATSWCRLQLHVLLQVCLVTVQWLLSPVPPAAVRLITVCLPTHTAPLSHCRIARNQTQ